MAVPKKKTVSAPAELTTSGTRTFTWPFGKKNYILFGVALVVIAIGYVFLAQGSITLAPLLLVVGYCVLVPWAILAKNPAKTETPAENPDVTV
jgi:hypothetical protein